MQTAPSKPKPPAVPGGLKAGERSKLDTGDRVDTKEMQKAQAENVHPGLPKQAAEVGLNPANWANDSSTGYALKLDGLPWSIPQATGTTVYTYAPVAPETVEKWRQDHSRDDALFFRLQEAGLAPDLAGAPAEPHYDYEKIRGEAPGASTLTACAPGTSMSAADQGKVRQLLGAAAVTMPASEWTSGGVAVVLPSTWKVRDLLPCYPAGDEG